MTESAVASLTGTALLQALLAEYHEHEAGGEEGHALDAALRGLRERRPGCEETARIALARAVAVRQADEADKTPQETVT